MPFREGVEMFAIGYPIGYRRSAVTIPQLEVMDLKLAVAALDEFER
jgi:hypothetical protein